MTQTSWIALAIVFLVVMFSANQANSTISFGANAPITASGTTIGIDIDTDGGLDNLTAGIGLSNCLTEGDVKVFDISEADWDCGIRVSGAGGSFVVQLDDVTTVATTTVLDFDDSQFVITESPAEEANVSIEDIYVLLAGDSSSGDYTLTGDVDVGGGALQIPNSNTLPGSCEVGDQYMDTDATTGQRLFLCESSNTWALQGDGSGGGSAIVLDLADDDADESADLSEIAITGDTNSIFTESSADKLLIAVGNDWPKADTADDLTCTDCIGATEISDIYVLIAGDSMAGDLLIDNQSELRLGELDSNGGSFITIRAPAALAANRTCTLEDDSTPFDPCVSSGGGGDITAVGPGYPTGAAFTDGLASSGTAMLVWEGTTADTNELTIAGPADPAVDQLFTFPDDQLADDDLIVANGAGTFEYKALPDCDASTDHALQYDQATNVFSCDSTADDDVPESGDFGAAADLDSTGAISCTNCLNATEIEDIYILVAGDVMAGNLDLADGSTDSPRVLFRVQAGTLWNLYAEDSTDDLQVEVDTGSTETVDFVNVGAGVIDITLDGYLIGNVDAAELRLKDASELTIASGSVTVTQSFHTIDGEGDAADTLTDIVGGVEGQILIIESEASARDITVASNQGTGTANIRLRHDIAMTLRTTTHKLVLIHNGASWNELARLQLAHDDYNDADFHLVDPADVTKEIRFDAGGISSGQIRVLTAPDENIVIVGTAATQTLSNKIFSDDLLIDNQSELRLGEPDGAGSEFIAILAPATLSANRTCILEDDSTPFDPCVSGAGGGDITAVGPGYPTGAAFTDGLASSGTAMLVWEGTTADTNELTIAGPEDPAVDQLFAFPDDQLADDDLMVANGAGTFEYKALPDCDASTDHALQYDQTTNVFSCDSTADDDSPEAGDYAAASIDGDDVNANIAGRSLTLTGASPDTLDVDVELYTDTAGIWFEDPTAADDFESIWVVNGFAVTITKIWCESDQTVNMDLQIDDGTPADVNGTDLVCDGTPAFDEAMGGDATMADGDRLDLAITSVSGTPTWVSIMWTYTKDD